MGWEKHHILTCYVLGAEQSWRRSGHEKTTLDKIQRIFFIGPADYCDCSRFGSNNRPHALLQFGSFLVSAMLMILGITLFNLGVDVSLMPIGEHVGSGLVKSKT